MVDCRPAKIQAKDEIAINKPRVLVRVTETVRFFSNERSGEISAMFGTEAGMLKWNL